MINFDHITEENIKEHNLNWPKLPDPSYRIFIIGGSRSGKTNSRFNLISHQPDIDNIYFYAKGPLEAKDQSLINKQGSIGLNNFEDPKYFIEYSDNMGNNYKNIEEYNPRKECKILIVFDDMIADMLSNKKLDPIVTELTKVEN